MAKFVATIKWGQVDADLDFEELPEAFKLAKNSPNNSLDALSQYLRCTFVPSNIFSDLSEIIEIDDDIEAEEVQITDVDFTSGGLPVIKAVAIFQLHLQDGVDESVLEAWQEENEYLDAGVVFQWELPEFEDDLSLTNYDELSFSYFHQLSN